ncbi:hypothetical protein ACFL0L_01720 [Patescibacteria group bacterium]
MKYLVSLVAIIAVFAFINTAHAGNYYYGSDGQTPLKAGDCKLVKTESEASEIYVYTLNPDYTILLNQSYFDHWQRNARCDELQFHVDHNTTRTRLRVWLRDIAYGWYSDIGASHLKNQTVSTGDYEWFFIQNGTIRRIPDILTAWSWGLLINDRITIPREHTDDFYNLTTLGAPLNFNDGQYVDDINDIWNDGNRDYSSLPSRLADDIQSQVSGTKRVFERCTYSSGSSPYRALLDWGWMLRNSGCALAS